MPDPIHLLVLIAVLAIGATLLWEYPVQIVLMAVVLAVVIDCLKGWLGIDVGGVTLWVDDIASLVLLLAGVIVVLRKGRFPDSTSWPVFTIFALLILNLGRGATEFGLKAAGNGSRVLAYLVIPSLAWMLLRPIARVDAQRLANWLCALGWILTVFAVCRWTGLLPMAQPGEGDFREVPRALSGEDAMLIGQSLLAIVYLQFIQRVRFWRICLAAVLAATTIALQHRSVWASTFAGLMWLAASSLRSSQRRWLQLAGSTFVGLTIAVVALSITTGGINSVVSLVKVNLDETQQENSTWSWRVKGFSEAMERLFSSDMFEIMLGPPSGRLQFGALDSALGLSGASVFIHNRYIHTFAYYGVFGGVLLLIWIFTVARKAGWWIRLRPGESPEMRVGTTFLQALLLSQLTYFVAYGGEIMQGSITALIWLATDARFGRVVYVVQRRPSELSRSYQLRGLNPGH
jgi:hypothetical protein